MLAELLEGTSRRILVVRLDNIGDMVMMGPALRSLKAAIPESHVTLMASPAGSQVAPMLPWVDELMVHRAVWQELARGHGQRQRDEFRPQRELELVERIRSGGFDAALIFTSFRQSPHPPAYACYLAEVPVRAALSKEFGGLILSHWIESPPDEVHQVDRNLYLLQGLGLRSFGRHLELSIPKSAEEEAEELLGRSGILPGDRFILLAPAASCRARTYDPSRFAEVAEMLLSETGLPIVVCGRDRDLPVVDAISGGVRSKGLVSIAGNSSVEVLAAVTRKAEILVASHSGPMHIADAVGCPMVIMFSGTDLRSQWEPRSAPSILLGRPVPCSPCYLLDCPYQMECLDIPPSEVARAGMQLLSRAAPEPGDGIPSGQNVPDGRAVDLKEVNECAPYAS
ncbi:MAG: glycosyltransferase family 9 protein [Actinomycetota bacterium]|nr:glycosyltransferase family 9 protein [Actinomycetota bacterium]